MDEARRLMLSRKRAMLAALLVDAFVDRLFAVSAEPGGDILAFREALAARHYPLAMILDLAAGRATLLMEAVEVPIADYAALGVEDFMVSLYNQHTVQRVRIAAGDERADVHEMLAAALAAVKSELSGPV